jgi:hypothetical protein
MKQWLWWHMWIILDDEYVFSKLWQSTFSVNHIDDLCYWYETNDVYLVDIDTVVSSIRNKFDYSKIKSQVEMYMWFKNQDRII